MAPTETTTYQVVVSNACGQENAAFTIGVNPLPTIELLQGSQDICAGPICATLAVAAANEDNLVWNTGATSASITLSPDQTTTYTALASNACEIGRASC
ncbi:hypothetical protein RZS08_63065, partial [Arthrospira platensis SPKY1]|nr:hypothetical protein [Arthrospira platensis SPKY1]